MYQNIDDDTKLPFPPRLALRRRSNGIKLANSIALHESGEGLPCPSENVTPRRDAPRISRSNLIGGS